MPKPTTGAAKRKFSTSFYHRPDWDLAEFGKGFHGDTIQKIAWCGLRDRCNGELSNLLHYLMWVLDGRYGGVHSFSTKVWDWTFDEGHFDSNFTLFVIVKRNGIEVAEFDANSDIKGRITWTFGFFDGEDVVESESFDLTAPSDINQAVSVVKRGIGEQLRRPPESEKTE